MIPEIVAAGDACLSIVFEQKIDPAGSARCVALAAEIERRRLAGVRDVMAAYHTVAVYFDPAKISRSALHHELEQTSRALTVEPLPAEPTPIEIVVAYGGEDGPDLASVAAFASCSEANVIRLHTEIVYRVYMIGFLPGFAYLGSVDTQIAMPRLESPRASVPAGSVGIAGAQTGIYPRATPGGWRIIGRTSVMLFDSTRDEPSLLKAGDRVKFVAA